MLLRSQRQLFNVQEAPRCRTFIHFQSLASLVVEDLSKRALRTALHLLAERPEGERVRNS